MKQSLSGASFSVSRTTRQAKARIGLIAAVSFLAVFAGLGFQYYRSFQARKMAPAGKTVSLSSGTALVLNGLKSPVEIRFYSLLDPASTSESLRAYAKRVAALLAEYERVGNGKVRVVCFDTLSDANANAAAADGIRAFNRDKGDACYLGIATVCAGQKGVIGELSPEWEPALESDLSRTVAGVNEVKTAAAPAVVNSDLVAAQQAIQSNPNLASATLDEGTQMLREAALAQLSAAVAEMQLRSQEAEQSLSQGVSAADVGKQLDQIHADETAKTQAIAARLHNQILALQQSKAIH
jgi:ABC-type uncharacterized transport system involved in gliding motility auxiliary subunit